MPGYNVIFTSKQIPKLTVVYEKNNYLEQRKYLRTSTLNFETVKAFSY